MRTAIGVLVVLSGLLGCTISTSVNVEEVHRVLNDWHDAAAKADEARYFGHMDENSIFMGTDATELWTKSEFLAYAKPYFDRGKAWTFSARSRNVYASGDGRVVWFDEVLDTQNMGECRGTGVLTKVNGIWKIQHYNLTVPVPNDKLRQVLSLIH